MTKGINRGMIYGTFVIYESFSSVSLLINNFGGVILSYISCVFGNILSSSLLSVANKRKIGVEDVMIAILPLILEVYIGNSSSVIGVL